MIGPLLRANSLEEQCEIGMNNKKGKGCLL